MSPKRRNPNRKGIASPSITKGSTYRLLPVLTPRPVNDTLLFLVRSVEGRLRATSDVSVYLQIADVLFGCVGFDRKEARLLRCYVRAGE